MEPVRPVEHSRPLPAIEKIKRDGKRREPPPRQRDGQRPPEDREPTPHIDEYA